MSEHARRYRVLEVLGRGSYGVVYRAEMSAPGGFTKQVALKLLHHPADSGDDVTVRLRDEARLLGLIQHRAVVGVDALVELEAGWAVVMQYVPGVDVTAAVQTGGIPARAALEIVEEVASALHTAYTVPNELTGRPLRVIHRDIKPSNIRITAQGEVKVLDFGVARSEFDGREAQSRDVAFGSWKYMSTERLSGVEGPAGDVYALGITTIEMLGGAVDDKIARGSKFEPWVEERIAAIKAKILREAPGTPAAVLDEVGALVRDMSNADDEARPTAEDVQQRCRRLIGLLDGEWLKSWAKKAVPSLLVSPAMPDPDPSLGTMLAEKEPASTRPVLTVASPPSRRGLVVTVAVAALTVAVIALMAVGVAGLSAMSLASRPDEAADTVASDPVAPASAITAASAIAAPSQVTPSRDPVASPSALASPDTVASPDAAKSPILPSAVRAASPTSAVTPEPATARRPAAPVPSEAHPRPDAAASDPSPVVEAPGTLVVRGDATDVALVGGGRRYGAGPVPPGRYAIEAAFELGGHRVVGNADIRSGETLTLRCAAGMMLCARQ